MTPTTATKTTDLEQFYIEVLKDPMLQEQLKSATDPESLSELAVELGKQKGYCFAKEEVLAAMATEAAMGGEYVEVSLPTAWLSPRAASSASPTAMSNENTGRVIPPW